MLDLIRKKQKSTLIKLVFWLIIAAFVGTIFLVWGKGRSGQETDESIAITVNGTDVSQQTFKTVYSNMYNFYQNVYGNSFNPELEKLLNIPQTAYDQIVRQVLLTQEGDRMGVSVSRQEVVDAIAKVPQFQVDGAFNRDAYVRVLSYQRVTPEAYEADQERALMTQKTEAAIQDSVTVSDVDIETEFVKQNEKVDLSFVRLNPADFEAKVAITDAALTDFYADHQEEFRVPARISLRYLQFDPARYTDEVTLGQDDIEKFYRRNRDLFVVEEQVTASHIKFKLGPNDSEKKKGEKRALAEKVLAKAKAGEDFAALARNYSDDNGSAAKGGELGTITRGTLYPEFEQAAFSLKPGEISDLVETKDGLEIIKATAYTPPGELPLEDVLDRVKAGLRVELSGKYALEKAMDAYNMNRKGGDLDKAAAEFNLGIKETGLFAKGESIDGIGTSPEVSDAAFALDTPGELAKPIPLPAGIFLIALKERKESHIPELADVRSKVEAAYRKEQSKVLADEAAAQLLADLKAGKQLATLAKALKVKVEETGPFAQTFGGSVPKIGQSDELAKAAFALTEEAPVAPQVYNIGDRFIVAVLKQKHAADLTQLDAPKREELSKTVLQAKRQEALKDRIELLKQEAKIIPSAYLISLGVKP